MRRFIPVACVVVIVLALAPGAQAKLWFDGLRDEPVRWGAKLSLLVPGCPGDQDCGIEAQATAVYLARGEVTATNERPSWLVRVGRMAADGRLTLTMPRARPGRYHLAWSTGSDWVPASDAFTVVRTVAAAERCPVSAPFQGTPDYGPATRGRGPAFPYLGAMPLRYQPPPQFDSRSWGGQKVLWTVRPGTSGPLVVRGVRLDGPEIVRFQDGAVPSEHLRLATDPSVSGWVQTPSYTRLRAPGCYAYVIDGPRIHETVVFRAAVGAS